MTITMQLRPYQQRAVDDALRLWHDGCRRVCLVAPTGSGKTIMGVELVARALEADSRVVWLAHRHELVRQAVEQLEERLGAQDVGAICPGFSPRPTARVQVATVQTLLSTEPSGLPIAHLLVWDEVHHAAAPLWRSVADAYPEARHLGLTATPERSDGVPLGDVMDQIVVAANYSDLLRDGYIVPCIVYQPPEHLKAALAVGPVEAYQRYAENSQAFCFLATVEQAEEEAQHFSEAGISAGCVHADTHPEDRQRLFDAFRVGQTRVLTNCFIMTEGIDVPEARTVILARGCGHPSPYLQMVGRVLRPAPGKNNAILVDLSGASLAHGLPTADRAYSLTGHGIAEAREAALRVCLVCGYTYEPTRPGVPCPRCGTIPEKREKPRPYIYNYELLRVYAGLATPEPAKAQEYERLRGVQRARDFGLQWVVSEYRKLFGAPPPLLDVTPDERYAEYRRLAALAARRQWKPGYAAVMYKQLFGQWPPWSYRQCVNQHSNAKSASY